MDHVVQKAVIDGQLLDVTIDIQQLPYWKQDVIRDTVDMINDPQVSDDERSLSRNTLAEALKLFER